VRVPWPQQTTSIIFVLARSGKETVNGPGLYDKTSYSCKLFFCVNKVVYISNSYSLLIFVVRLGAYLERNTNLDWGPDSNSYKWANFWFEWHGQSTCLNKLSSLTDRLPVNWMRNIARNLSRGLDDSCTLFTTLHFIRKLRREWSFVNTNLRYIPRVALFGLKTCYLTYNVFWPIRILEPPAEFHAV
jgi:hypothetical protein